MLIERSRIDIVDNSGAVRVMVFHVGGKNGTKFATVGDIVRGSVKKANPHGKVKKGDVVSVLIVGTANKISRKDGTSIKFSKNMGVVVNKNNKEPIATRVLAPVCREIKDLGHSKVASLAPEVL
jgi:large subunit ribosomal protein L14